MQLTVSSWVPMFIIPVAWICIIAISPLEKYSWVFRSAWFSQQLLFGAEISTNYCKHLTGGGGRDVLHIWDNYDMKKISWLWKRVQWGRIPPPFGCCCCLFALEERHMQNIHEANTAAGATHQTHSVCSVSSLAFYRYRVKNTMKFISCNDPKIFTLESQCFSRNQPRMHGWALSLCVNLPLSPPPPHLFSQL